MGAYSAKAVISGLPASQRVSLTYDSTTVTAGRASINADVAVSLYGEDAQYSCSFWFDSADFSPQPTGNNRCTVDSTQYTILGVHKYPGNLRRLDVGGKYGG